MTNSSSDSFDLIENITKKYFTEIEHFIPYFQQTLFDFQNEYYKAWKNTLNSNILLQKEFAKKSKSNLILPPIYKNFFEDSSEIFLQYRMLGNKIAIKSIESVKNNIKILDENSKTIVEMNKKLMKFWFSTFYQK